MKGVPGGCFLEKGGVNFYRPRDFFAGGGLMKPQPTRFFFRIFLTYTPRY